MARTAIQTPLKLPTRNQGIPGGIYPYYMEVKMVAVVLELCRVQRAFVPTNLGVNSQLSLANKKTRIH